MEVIRHGDVILRKVTIDPAAQKKGRKETKKRQVLALGEITGHKHVLNGSMLEVLNMDRQAMRSATMLRADELFAPSGGEVALVRTDADDVVLSHEEHGPVKLPKTKPNEYWLVTGQRESWGENRQVTVSD